MNTMQISPGMAHVMAKTYGCYKTAFNESRDRFYSDGMARICRALEKSGYGLSELPDGQFIAGKMELVESAQKPLKIRRTTRSRKEKKKND